MRALLRASLILVGAALLATAALTCLLDSSEALPRRAQAAAADFTPIRASSPQQGDGGDENLSIGNDTCLGCHGSPGPTLTLENGDILDLYVNPADYAASIHGQKGYACVQCHTTVGNYPHPEFKAASLRDASLQRYTACQSCHGLQYSQAADSVHGKALASGNQQAAICTDCHTAHEVKRLNDPQTHTLLPSARASIPQTCAKCHFAIYQKYKTSVHGAALLEESNPDVPTCIDCHGVHNIEDPTTAAFRLQSPQICAKCHTDEKLMSRYGISTNVMNSYVADFHGTTVTIFEKQSPDAETNKAVCYDCHGVHDISRPDDPITGIQSRKENLLARCRKCHPEADANFPTAWLSHYEPSPEKYPIVYYVNLFYKLFIPGVLGSMALLVALDVGRSFYNRSREKQQKIEAAALPKEAPAVELPPEASLEPPPSTTQEAPGGESAVISEDAALPLMEELPEVEAQESDGEPTSPPPQEAEDETRAQDTPPADQPSQPQETSSEPPLASHDEDQDDASEPEGDEERHD